MSLAAGNSKMASSSTSTTAPFFHEFKKQASFFLKEKIKSARLALTDVTPAELLTEEATNGNSWAPDTRTMGLISRAAFEIDDYERIVEILHKRLSKFDKKHWRECYKAVILLEHLLTHGPESIAPEFQSDGDVIREMGSFQYIDERGFNWGLTVRKKSERVLQLLEKSQLLKEERARARKLTRGIQGFGSFTHRPSSSSSSMDGTFFIDQSNGVVSYGRSNSYYSEYDDRKEVKFGSQRSNQSDSKPTNYRDAEGNHRGLTSLVSENEGENSNRGDMNVILLQIQKSEDPAREPLKENVAADTRSSVIIKNKVNPFVPLMKKSSEEHHHLLWDHCKESKPLLDGQQDESSVEFITEDHPFNHPEQIPNTASLLSVI